MGMNVARALVVLTVAHATRGFGSGAPSGACSSLEPLGHQMAKRDMSLNYTITIPSTATPGQSVKVVINGNPDTFKGFIVQGIDGSGVVGQFTGPGSMRCNSAGDTATHTHPMPKDREELTYVVPAGVDRVFVRGTVLKDYSNYRVNVYSNEMVVKA